MAALLMIAALTMQSGHAGATSCDLIRSEQARQNARQAMESKHFAEAARNFQEAFDACPSQHSILLQMSEANLRRREFTGDGSANEFLKLEPGSITGELALANAYFMAQRLPDSLQKVDDVLKLQPAEPTALKLRGNIQYLSGQPDKALKTFMALLDIHPEDEEGAYMLGRIYYQEGRMEQASGQFQRVLRINPKSYKALDHIRAVLRGARRYRDGDSVFFNVHQAGRARCGGLRLGLCEPGESPS